MSLKEGATAHDLLAEQVLVLGSKQAAATALGVSRTAVSLYLAGKLGAAGGRVDRLEARILAMWSNRLICPHLARDMSAKTCTANRTRPMPTSDPAALKLWIACKSCKNNICKEERVSC